MSGRWCWGAEERTGECAYMQKTTRGDRRIVMVLESNYPTEGGGGAEGQLRTLSRWLSAHGIGVHIVVPMREWDTRENDEVDGVPVWRVPDPRVRQPGGVVILWRIAPGVSRRRRRCAGVPAPHRPHL